MTPRNVREVLVSIPRRSLVFVVRFYQLVVSPWTPPSCRFYPSCSHYAVVALERHGVFRGGWLAVRRVGRCHPWAAGGIDDVPPRVVADGHISLQHTSAHAGHHQH